LAIFDAEKSITIQRQLSEELKYYDSDMLKDVIARMKSRVPQESNPQSEIASPFFQRGRNDILWPPVTKALLWPELRTWRRQTIAASDLKICKQRLSRFGN